MLFTCKLKDFHSIQFLQKVREFQEFAVLIKIDRKIAPKF